MYTDVIIGYDGSASGRDALALGRRLARATAAETTVLCVHPYQALTSDVEIDAAFELSWRRHAEKILDEARVALDDAPDVSFRARAETSVARALHGLALEAAAALIVVGSSHRTGIARFLPGSTAAQVIHAAPCAVAIAPAGYADHEHDRRAGVIGAAVDGGRESERVARIGARIARGAHATLRLLAVAHTHESVGLPVARLSSSSVRQAVHDSARNALARAVVAAGSDVEVESRLIEGTPAERLAAESHDLDLLIVGSRGYGRLRRIVLGSVTTAVMRDAGCPVLALPRGTAGEIDASVAAIARAMHR
jgi:nucleotide-binding universal stress UspA family protein